MERFVDFVKIGEGSFGSVHKAVDSEGGETVAVKVFHNAGAEVTRSAIREARMLAECCHCNITGLREAYQSSSGRVYLVLEYAQHVLSQQLKMHRKGLPPVAVRSIIFQLLQALQYLHNKGIMHRDCKPANILITGDGMVKLCDFGFARYVRGGAPADAADEPLTSYVITRWYRPPEVLAGQRYTTAVDIWAVGCIFAEMLTGYPLFPGTSTLDQMYIEYVGLGGLAPQQEEVMHGNEAYAIVKEEFQARQESQWDTQETVFDRLAPMMSKSMLAFFKACLCPDPDQRATATQLLDMAFIREGAWEAPPPTAGPPPVSEAQRAAREASPPPPPRSDTSTTQNTTSAPMDLGSSTSINKPQKPLQQTRSSESSNAKRASVELPSASYDGDRELGSANQRGSANRKLGPTVKQRRADEVVRMLESESEDEATKRRLRRILPPGLPLSDSDSDGAQTPTSHSTASTATHHTTAAKPGAAPQQPQQPAQPRPAPAVERKQPAPGLRGQVSLLQQGHLHTSFAPGLAATAAAAATAARRFDPQPLISAISAEQCVVSDTGAAAGQNHTQGTVKAPGRMQTQQEDGDSSDGVSETNTPRETPTHGGNADPNPFKSATHEDEDPFSITAESPATTPADVPIARPVRTKARAAKATLAASVAGPVSDPTSLRRSVDTAMVNIGMGEGVGERASRLGEQERTSDQKVRTLKPANRAMQITQSMSGVLLPSKCSIATAKPMAGITHRDSDTPDGADASASAAPAAKQSGSGSGKSRGSRRRSAKPTPGQMTAAAITQATTQIGASPTLATTLSGFGSKSMHVPHGHGGPQLECPPPPGGAAPAPPPPPRGARAAPAAAASSGECGVESDGRMSDGMKAMSLKARRHSLAAASQTLQVSGRLNRLDYDSGMATTAQTANTQDYVTVSGEDRDSVDSGAVKSNNKTRIATRMSVPTTGALTSGDAQASVSPPAGALAASGTIAPANSVAPPLSARPSRGLSPMGVRMGVRLTASSKLVVQSTLAMRSAHTSETAESTEAQERSSNQRDSSM